MDLLLTYSTRMPDYNKNLAGSRKILVSTFHVCYMESVLKEEKLFQISVLCQEQYHVLLLILCKTSMMQQVVKKNVKNMPHNMLHNANFGPTHIIINIVICSTQVVPNIQVHAAQVLVDQEIVQMVSKT